MPASDYPVRDGEGNIISLSPSYEARLPDLKGLVGATPKSGRFLVPDSYTGLANISLAQDRIFLTPVVVGEEMTFTEFGFASHTVTSAIVKVGIYADKDGAPDGLPIEGTVGVSSEITSAGYTQQVVAFDEPVVLPPARYWLAMLSNVTGTFANMSASGNSNAIGALSMTSSNGAQIYYASAYAGGRVDLTGKTLVYNNGSGMFHMGLKVQ